MAPPARPVAWASVAAAFTATTSFGEGGVQTADVYSGDAVPQLAVLGIRCADRPIDLEPPFAPDHYVYSAFLDFAEGSFAVDALPAPGMRIVNTDTLLATALVGPGESHRVDVNVEDSESKASMEYTVTVSRLDGTDVKLRSLDVGSAQLLPSEFDPSVTDYYVAVLADQDYLKLSFIPWDSGQTFFVYAQDCSFEDPFAATTTTMAPLALAPATEPVLMLQTPDTETNSSNATKSSQDQNRRLATANVRVGHAAMATAVAAAAQLGRNSGLATLQTLSGEVQYQPVTRFFPADPGVQRVITLAVKPANGDSSGNGSYSFKVTRARCPPARPLFAPDAGMCSSTCNLGYYPDAAAARCKGCSYRCHRCTAYDACLECDVSQWENLDFVELKDGYCQPWEIPEDARRRRLIMLGLGTVAVLFIACCAALACAGVNGSSHRRARPFAPRGVGDDPGDEANRLLDDGDGGVEGS